jgi:hypothetical protein
VLAIGKHETNMISAVRSSDLLTSAFIYLKLRGEMYMKYSLETFFSATMFHCWYLYRTRVFASCGSGKFCWLLVLPPSSRSK